LDAISLEGARSGICAKDSKVTEVWPREGAGTQVRREDAD